MDNFILYFHINATTNAVFYVGIGKPERAIYKRGRSKWWHHTVDKYGYDVLIEEENLTWNEACELEKYWIKRIGRRQLNTGTLINMTDGGEGVQGVIRSDETRQRMSEAQKGKISPNKGKKLSLDAREKIRIAKLGKASPMKGKKSNWKPTSEQLEKMSESHKNIKHTDEAKEKIRLSKIGRKKVNGKMIFI